MDNDTNKSIEKAVNDDYISLCSNIGFYRRKAGLSQEQLATAISDLYIDFSDRYFYICPFFRDKAIEWKDAGVKRSNTLCSCTLPFDRQRGIGYP